MSTTKISVLLLLSILLVSCATKKDKHPENPQHIADIGWSYIQSGRIRKGVELLLNAPIEPSCSSTKLFPTATGADERRRLYLKTINACMLGIDGEKLVIGHVFVSHLSTEKITDEELISQLRMLAKRTRSPVVYDALRELSFEQGDWEHQVQYAEETIRRMESLGLQVKDAEHLGHFYFNAAFGHTMAKDYDKAVERMRDAISINNGLRLRFLRDPGFEDLRRHVGIEKFRWLIGMSQWPALDVPARR